MTNRSPYYAVPEYGPRGGRYGLTHTYARRSAWHVLHHAGNKLPRNTGSLRRCWTPMTSDDVCSLEKPPIFAIIDMNKRTSRLGLTDEQRSTLSLPPAHALDPRPTPAG